MARPRLISLGSINLDLQSRVARWPQPGEALIARELLRIGGGKAANAAFIARRLGAEAMLLGNVGLDEAAETALAGVQAEGVDLRHVEHMPGAATGLAMVFVRPDGEKTIVLAPNANDRWRETQADAVADGIDGAPDDSVLVADLEVPRFIVLRAMRAARSRGFPIVLDPSPAETLSPELLELADCVTPNQSEAGQLIQRTVESKDDAFEAARALVERGAGTALVKLATGGCVVVSADEHFAVTGFRVPVVDKTGGGDAFAGALGVALLEAWRSSGPRVSRWRRRTLR